ncbi:MAG TPA: anti-sigma factor [Clostridiales bacterium]|jgi:hypothetical protein|nr:anti-sigma factor [Clostridiales bacterium]
MERNSLDRLKEEYMEIPIPKELDARVKTALGKRRKGKMRRKRMWKGIGIAAAFLIICVGVLTAGINGSPAFAAKLSRVPALHRVVEVLNFQNYTVDEGKYHADIKVPSIQGLGNKDLEHTLNEKYLKENKKLYEDFMSDMEEMKKSNTDGHMGVDSGYTVLTDTDRILSVARYVVNTVGSSSTVMKYDTIDKEKEILITLPSLFKDNSYVDIISANIKKQMTEQNKKDPDKVYWVEGINNDFDGFQTITADQNFYITAEEKLMISFDKYEVAPGYMGTVEFEIPTDILSGILVSDEYIK